ncbi:MAG TPA: Wzz/FepE/Etk N-terminal domain-containing protein [Kouleothrix sp.]|uniref:YveK family protein n=1 Tax=Kouleothrix sp. TaxID=2779161 RepID=UPI002BB3063D|nr:Wzz/FepE/Etk N-terminal domain-containing protein [Kouleothrix sp.]HRC77224.1 Wzz/FepE/Etk N-terminal domain-containing protein [Kouleothrix sp.]
MQIIDYVNILRRRWWIIVLAAVVTSGSAYVFTRFQERLYRSEATYLVLANQLDNGLSIVLQNSMNSYRELALAPRELDKVSQQQGLDRSAEWLLNKHVAIQPLPDERKIVVQVTYPDAEVAPRLANAIGQNMVGLVASLNSSLEGSSRINLRELQPADRVSLYWPQTRVIVAAGGILGLVIGLLLAFVLEALDSTLKSATDIERFVGLTTLGAIPTVE